MGQAHYFSLGPEVAFFEISKELWLPYPLASNCGICDPLWDSIVDRMRRLHVCASLMAKIAVLLVTCSPSIVFAAPRDYSGTFVRQTRSKRKNLSDLTVLRVVQTEEAIEITRTRKNKELTNRFPFNGKEGAYTTAYGAQGICKAEFKDNYLRLESVVLIEEGLDVPRMLQRKNRLRRREQWQLSSDNKILIIKMVSDFPDLPTSPPYPSNSPPVDSKVDPFNHSPHYGQVTSWTDKYERRNE